MRVPIVDIGNSRGIRIPQAILKQVSFGQEVEMDVADGKIILRRLIDPSLVPDFDSMASMDDAIIQRILRKISGTDLITAMVGAAQTLKQAIYRNLSDRVREHVKRKVARLEKGDARDLIIERSRNAISEALMEVMTE
jgi:antitoxin component of MazEF toxin-antitoxin module